MVNRLLVAAALVAGLSVPAFSATAPVPSAGGTAATNTTSTPPPGTPSGGKPTGTKTSGGSSTKAWYVAQNDKTMNCIVTPSKPNGTTYMMIGMMTYPTVSAATTAMHAAMECKPVVKAKT
jgi:hypothetical protein